MEETPYTSDSFARARMRLMLSSFGQAVDQELREAAFFHGRLGLADVVGDAYDLDRHLLRIAQAPARQGIAVPGLAHAAVVHQDALIGPQRIHQRLGDLEGLLALHDDDD